MASPEVQKIVDDLIRTKKVMVFSKSYCPFCTKAKNALAPYNIPADDYYVWEIEHEPQMAEIQTYLKQLTGASSVPRVFINGKFIGGGDDTAQLHKSGQLAQLLQ
ncbi:PREDICTED: glutaredoxin-C4-like [Rhagoletis zephyria]|uniref:glutaredoxin-C4-like n=1 Tax=Rhagoletis zephyria TaxID=28612 RepID=UPI000811891F|nr:PREDICTED: glutaredoxin-C4-like [Rhagoletis zephyria]KAH9399700.1 electron transport chain [Tyrophagus putrescentiae]